MAREVKFLYFLTLVIFLVFIIASFCTFVGAFEVKSTRDNSKASVSPSSDSDMVRVMITPKDNKNSTKQEIKSKISKAKIKRDYNNSFSATISRKEYENLKKDSKISKIEIIPSKKLSLQNSIPLINATLVHSTLINGVNLTGRGQTICIIDSGVNYSHPDLGGCYGNNNASSNCKVIGGIDYCADDSTCTTTDSDPMDVNGHGTHVSGIAAANGTITGVAPEAKIIMIKASSSGGTFYDDDLRAAIDWCVANYSIFNISVISMSLGSDTLYSSYCDYQDDPMNLTLAINNAVAKNISVVVATGNSGNYLSISSPACLTNVTPIGSSTKSDVIALTSNANLLVQILAPGDSISSTCISGGSCVKSGTSMATPHAAGAIAIINQYLQQTLQIKNTQQVESILNSTGKPIVDIPWTNYTYYRININQAILNLTNNTMRLSLIFPQNRFFTNNNNTSFTCKSYGINLTNITFYLWNSTSIVYNETQNLSGNLNQTSFNYTLPLENSYLWNCRSVNNDSNSAFANANYSVIYDITKPNLTIMGIVDGYSETSSSAALSFSYNASDANNVSNCSLIVNGAVNSVNVTVNYNSTNSITSTFSSGSYNWSINCSDYAGNIENSSVRSFIISAPAASTTRDGGGGGGGSSIASISTYILSNNQLNAGYTNELGNGNVIKFNLPEKSGVFASGSGAAIGQYGHSLTLNVVGENYVRLTIRSEPINVTLFIGEEKKLNISSAEFYDLYLRLNSITNNKANLTIKTIAEPIIKVPLSFKNISEISVNEKIIATEPPKISIFLAKAKVYIYAVAVIILAVLIHFILKKKAKTITKTKKKR